MNALTNMQRKLVYFVGILVLLVPIMMLGMPAGTDSEGGTLAQLRKSYDLGEANLGQVDLLYALRTWWPLTLVLWGGLELVDLAIRRAASREP